jgi:hypothetical protein
MMGFLLSYKDKRKIKGQSYHIKISHIVVCHSLHHNWFCILGMKISRSNMIGFIIFSYYHKDISKQLSKRHFLF